MLAEVQSLHKQLLALITELEGLTAEPAADEGKIANLRYRLSRASGQRRTLMEQRVYPELIDVLPAHEAAEVESLRAQGAAAVVASSDHIREWTLSRIGEDWAGYQRASAAMRSAMRDRIMAEQALLFPLLRKIEREDS